MVSREIVLGNAKGLHLRPAGKVCDLALNYKSRTQMVIGNRTYNLKSVLSVLSAQVVDQKEVTIVCEGPDEKEALEAVCGALESDLDGQE